MEIIQFENWPVYKLTKRKFLWNKSKVRLVAVQRFHLVGEISVWSLPNLVTTWFSISVILPKSMLGQNGDGLSTLSLTVVHFSRPNPMQICACAWIYRWTKKLWKIRSPGHRGPPGREPLPKYFMYPFQIL